MLQLSLQHRITYWLRTCTHEETAEMAGRVDCCIMEAIQATPGVEFDTEVMAKERLRLQARMKGGGIKRAADVKYLTFLGGGLTGFYGINRGGASTGTECPAKELVLG